MNVLLIRSDVRLAGPAKLMHAYARALRSAGHSVQVASGGGEYAPELEKDGFRHTIIEGLRIRSRNPLGAPASLWKLSRLIRRERIDVINSFNAHAGLLAAVADPTRRSLHFNTVLGTGREWTNRFLPGKIVAVSSDVEMKLLKAGVPSRKIDVVYNSTLSDRFFTDPPSRTDNGPVRICNVAMFTGDKGQEFIIPLIAKLLHERGRDIHLTLVGDGPSRKACEAMACNLGIGDHVEFAGALRDVIPVLDSCDVFIHLPRTETFGIVLAEAMARMLPIVTIGIGGIPEVVTDGVSGIVLDSRDNTAELLAALERLIDNPAERRRMGDAGRACAREQFSLRALQRNLEQLYC